MALLLQLAQEVETARAKFIQSASGLAESQTTFRPDENSWSIIDNVEHLVWAEMGGILGMWKTADSIRAGQPIWTGEAIHHGLPIESIIAKTWEPKEKVPEVAKPRWGGPVAYWIMALQNCQPLLEALVNHLTGLDPEKVIYPHAISGPLNVVQRLAFLRFHLDRHRDQIGRIKSHANYPKTKTL